MIALLLSLALYAHADEILDQEIKQMIASCETRLSGGPTQQELKDAMTAGQNMKAYFKVVDENIVERDYVSQGFQNALIGRQPVLFVGAPGNGKTMYVNYVLGNIIDEQTGKPSYFTDQMTFETTLSDTHGSLDFQKLMQSGRQVRFLDEGILGHYFSLLDEQFDMRPNAFRNILTALAEGRYKGEIGKSWMIVGASNKSIPEVYARFNIYDDSARALIDRYAYVFYVGAELTMERNNVKIIQNGGQPPAPPPRLTVQDLEKLNALLKHVEIPLHVAHLLSYVDYQLKQMLEANESNSLTSYLEKLARGEPPSTPPWKSTKYMSPRTLGRSATILRAAIVRDWVEKGGRRDLVASVEDLQSLTSFFALNGPSEKDVMFLQTRTTKDTERDQLNTVQMERSIVQKLLEDAVGEFNRALETLSPLQDSLVKLRNRRAMKAPQKAELENEVKAHFLRAYAARKILDTAMRAELSPELIAQESILEVSYDVLKALNPDPDALNEKIKVWIQEMEKDPEAFARATPAPVAAPEVTVHPVKADQVDFVEMDSQAFQDNDVFGGEFLVSSDSRAFFALTSHGLNILTAGRATGGISWAGAMNPMSMTGKFILYRQDQNPIYSYNSDQPRFTEANPRQLFNPTQQNLFFADEARNQFLMVSSPVGQPNTVVRAFNPVDGRMTDLENVSLSAITDYDSSDLWQPAFSWQASTGAHFTLADHYRKLYKYQVGSGVVSPAPWADALNRQSLKMVGRYGDTIFLANPTHLIQLDPVAEKLTGKKIISNSFNPDLNTVWISKLGANSLHGKIKLWAYIAGEGLVLRSISPAKSESQLILAESEIAEATGFSEGLNVERVFEDGDGNVLLMIKDINEHELHILKITKAQLLGT